MDDHYVEVIIEGSITYMVPRASVIVLEDID